MIYRLCTEHIFNPPNNLHILILTIIFTSHSAFSSLSFLCEFSLCTDYNRSSSSIHPFHLPPQISLLLNWWQQMVEVCISLTALAIKIHPPYVQIQYKYRYKGKYKFKYKHRHKYRYKVTIPAIKMHLPFASKCAVIYALCIIVQCVIWYIWCMM